MTPEQLRQNAAAMIAFADGKPIQQRHDDVLGGEWHDASEYCLFAFDAGWEHRPKPEPKMRPWSKPEDVPGPVCWLRWPDEPLNQSMIVGVDGLGVTSFLRESEKFADESWMDLIGQEYSTDRKTWHKCEVPE